MASIKNILFLFAILVSSTVILAQNPSSNNSSSNEASSIPPNDGGGSSDEPPVSSSAPGMFDHFPFKPLKFDWPQIPAGFFTGESRHKRQVGRTVIRCNYATEGGFKCTGCNTVRRCYAFNMGTDSTCSGLFQYCNNGQCSRTKGSLCSDTTSTSSSTTGSTSSTGSTDSTGSTGTTGSTGSTGTTGSTGSTGTTGSTGSTGTTGSTG